MIYFCYKSELQVSRVDLEDPGTCFHLKFSPCYLVNLYVKSQMQELLLSHLWCDLLLILMLQKKYLHLNYIDQFKFLCLLNLPVNDMWVSSTGMLLSLQYPVPSPPLKLNVFSLHSSQNPFKDSKVTPRSPPDRAAEGRARVSGRKLNTNLLYHEHCGDMKHAKSNPNMHQ